jgi:FkbM family methyltransferase
MTPPTLNRNRNGANKGRLCIVGVSAFVVLCTVTALSASRPAELHSFLISNAGGRSLSSDGLGEAYLGTSNNAVSINKYKAVSCPAMLSDTRAEGSQVMDPNDGILYGKQVELHPRFWVSLHNEEFDTTRWHIMKYGDYYETALSKAFVEVLKDASPGARVLDVGGNIGYFTLLSAANGPVGIDVFEPNAKNRLRMCESLLLNHWYSEFDNQITSDPLQVSTVNLYPFGIGRQEGTFVFSEHANPGQGKFSETPGSPGSYGLQVITLDNFARERGWFQPETRPNILVLKVDVEGFEYSVIEGATELLKAKIVENVFMEVSAREQEEIDINKPALKFLAQSGYKLHKVGGYRGPNKPVEFTQDVENIADHIMMLTLEEGAKQLNLWWKLAP